MVSAILKAASKNIIPSSMVPRPGGRGYMLIAAKIRPQFPRGFLKWLDKRA